MDRTDLAAAAGHPLSTYLVCGFLGAGKTTYILERLKDRSTRTAVLVNEFGTLGIDGQTIRTRGGIDVVEMAGGCICCSQRQGLVKSVTQIATEIKPDLLLIEPSGVAETSELLSALSDNELANIARCDGTITIIDATTFLDYCEPDSFGTFFLDQIVNADVILINKIDLVAQGTLDEIESRIKEINPGARVARTIHCRHGELPSRAGERSRCDSHRERMAFESMSLELHTVVSYERLERFLGRLASGDFGEILRVKGFVHVEGGEYVEVQATPAHFSIEAVQEPTPSRLVFVGRNLARSSLGRYFVLEETG